MKFWLALGGLLVAVGLAMSIHVSPPHPALGWGFWYLKVPIPNVLADQLEFDLRRIQGDLWAKHEMDEHGQTFLAVFIYTRADRKAIASYNCCPFDE